MMWGMSAHIRLTILWGGQRSESYMGEIMMGEILVSWILTQFDECNGNFIEILLKFDRYNWTNILVTYINKLPLRI